MDGECVVVVVVVLAGGRAWMGSARQASSACVVRVRVAVWVSDRVSGRVSGLG